MYPESERTQIAAKKARLQRKIGRHRVVFLETTGQMSRSLGWVDTLWALGRQHARWLPAMGLSLGVLMRCRSGSRWPRVSTILKWVPVLGGLLHGMQSR